MSKLLKIMLLISSIILIGCSSTAYRPLKSGIGYSDLQVNTTTYKVSYAGNHKISLDTLHDYLLYRCSELTLEKGYKYFVILDSDTSHVDSYYSPVITSLPYTVTLRSSQITVIIKLLKTNSQHAYDASLVKNSLSSQFV